MALIFAEGWDTAPEGNIQTWLRQRGVLDNGITGLQRAPSRFGSGYAVLVGSRFTSGIIGYSGTGLVDGGCAGGAFKHNGFSTGNDAKFIHITFSNNAVLEVRFNGETQAQVYCSNPSLTGTFFVPAGTGQYNFYEVRWNATVIEVALNNEVVYTSALGVGMGAALATQVQFCAIAGSVFSDTYCDEIYVADDPNFYNDMYIKPATLLATETNTGTVYGAITAHDALSSVDGDTSYINFNGVGQKVVCTLSDIVETNPAAIHGVVLSRQARKDETGTVSERFLIKRGTTEYEVGPSFAGLALGHTGRRIVLPTDPATSAAWTKAGTEDMRAGLKRV